VRINVNQRFALKYAADAHKALEERATSGSTVLVIEPTVHRSFFMSKTTITSPELAPPVGPFSQAVEAGGFIYFSGQVGQDPTTGKLVAGGIEAETERVFRNLSALLKAAGKSFDDVVRAGVFLTSMSDFVALNVAYAKHFRQPFPAVRRSELPPCHWGPALRWTSS
jgi:2-iminobutanoate/2-iminopropanoate deaminase